MRGLVAILPRDQNAEDRILRASIGEVGRQERRARRVDVILDRRIGRELAADDFLQRLGPPLMHDIDSRRHMFAEPRCQGAEMVAGLVLVDLLVAAGGGSGLFTRAGIKAQRPVERVVPILQPKEDFVGLLFILEIGGIEWLEEIEIEVACRLRGRALVRSAEEQVPASAHATLRHSISCSQMR